MDDDSYSVTRAYLIFVTDITGGGCGEQVLRCEEISDKTRKLYIQSKRSLCLNKLPKLRRCISQVQNWAG